MPTTRLTPAGYGSPNDNASYHPSVGIGSKKRSLPSVEARTSLPRAKKIRAQYIDALPPIDIEMDNASPDASGTDASNSSDQDEMVARHEENSDTPFPHTQRLLSSRLMAKAHLSSVTSMSSLSAKDSSTSAAPSPAPNGTKRFLHNMVA